MTTAHLSGLSASIVATLKERIIGWKYPPEHRLTEETLCLEFGVSRSPVREALRILVTNGFVRKLANRGYAVRQLDPGGIEELYDVRIALETHVVERLARDEDGRRDIVPELQALRREWESVLEGPQRKGEELAELDQKFHETLASIAGNRTLLENLRAINERLLVFRMIDFGQPDRTRMTCRQHVAILERIAAGDGEGARTAMCVNIGDGRSNVNSVVKEALARAYSVGVAARPSATPRREKTSTARRRPAES